MAFNGASLAQTVRKLMDQNRSTYRGGLSTGNTSTAFNHPKPSDLDEETIQAMFRPTRKYGFRATTPAGRFAARVCLVLFLAGIAWLIRGCVMNSIE